VSPAPTISVLMPVRNGERFLAEAVESVLSQTFRDLELLVIDDGSTDSTPQILERLGIEDPRLVIHRREPGPNLPEVLNFGAELARAPLLARLDADDVALPDRFQLQVAFLAAHPEVALVGGQVPLIDESGREIGRAEYPLTNEELQEALCHRNPFVHSAMVMRREAFEEVGGYRPNFVHAEDLDLWLRLADVHRIANLPADVVQYRIHGSQQTLQKQDEQALYSTAARASARARAAGLPDPFNGVKVDEALLISQGVSREELTESVVSALAWLGRTTGRAGYADSADRLFEAALARARSESGSPELVASVYRSIARRHAEEGHRVRARVRAVQARLAERRSWR
jgi:hypothetical protein